MHACKDIIKSRKNRKKCKKVRNFSNFRVCTYYIVNKMSGNIGTDPRIRNPNRTRDPEPRFQIFENNLTVWSLEFGPDPRDNRQQTADIRHQQKERNWKQPNHVNAFFSQCHAIWQSIKVPFLQPSTAAVATVITLTFHCGLQERDYLSFIRFFRYFAITTVSLRRKLITYLSRL